MKKVLITGISGFIGQYLSSALVDMGYEVHGLYEHSKSFAKNPTVKHKHLFNLTDYIGVDMLIDKIKPDFVIHLAAKTEVALSFDNYLEVSEVNYVGTVNLIEANRLHNPKLKLFLMASTMETYGHQKPSAFTEQTPQYPMAPYSVAKLACEYYLKYAEYAYGLPFTILRQTNAYGRTDNNFFVMERIISQMLAGEVCNLGENKPVRNFIWIEDLIELYIAILKKSTKAKGQVFVTGPKNGIKIGDLANLIATKLSWQGRINWGTIPKRPGEIYYLNSNPKKAKELLGWEPTTTLDDGIEKLIEIMRSTK